jgi:predicted nucleotidyltransferase
MNILIENHKRLLLALLKHNVEFILIGGYAVVYYGYSRATGDMDIWLKPDNQNKIKFLKAVEDFGIDKNDIIKLSEIDFTKANTFYTGEEPERIDFLTQISGVKWDNAIENTSELRLEEKRVPVIHFRDLIVNKMISDRPKDKADVDELQRINKYRKPPHE